MMCKLCLFKCGNQYLVQRLEQQQEPSAALADLLYGTYVTILSIRLSSLAVDKTLSAVGHEAAVKLLQHTVCLLWLQFARQHVQIIHI